MNSVKRATATTVFALLFSMLLAACASVSEPQYVDMSPRYPANEENIEPGAFLVDRFFVNHKTPKRDTSALPFYFQKCTREIGNFISTRSRYDCD